MRYPLAALFVCLAAAAQAQTTDHGPTFRALDDEATRVITWYGDVYAITERGPDAALRTRLFDRPSSTVIATAEYLPGGDDRPAVLRADIPATAPIVVEQAAPPPRAIAWANTQLRELWLDQKARRGAGAAGRASIVSDGALWRMADAVAIRRRPVGPALEDADVEGIASEYPEAMAVTQRDHHPAAPRGWKIAQSTFTARVFDAGGRQVGVLRWFDRERTLTWSFPNGRRGTALESRVPGGFKFTPTMAWANVQGLAFLRHSARPAPPKIPVPPSFRDAVAASMSFGDRPASGPSAAAVEMQDGCDGVADGCTGLHFLDGSIFEECCTRHDLCYERDQPDGCCEAWSWFLPNPFWHCSRCNFAAVWCFLTRGEPEPPPDEGPLGQCERQTYADWCAPECQTCRTREDFGGGRN